VKLGKDWPDSVRLRSPLVGRAQLRTGVRLADGQTAHRDLARDSLDFFASGEFSVAWGSVALAAPSC
jgi:hypothetical protein